MLSNINPTVKYLTIAALCFFAAAYSTGVIWVDMSVNWSRACRLDHILQIY